MQNTRLAPPLLGALYRTICHCWGHRESRQFEGAGRHPWQWDHLTLCGLYRNRCCHLYLWLKPQERTKDWWMPVWLLFRACCWSPSPFGASPTGVFLEVCTQGGLSLCLSDVSPGWYAPGLSWRQQKCPGPVFYLCLRTCLETVLAKTVLRHVLDRWRCRFSISVLDRRLFFKFKFKFLLTH